MSVYFCCTYDLLVETRECDGRWIKEEKGYVTYIVALSDATRDSYELRRSNKTFVETVPIPDRRDFFLITT